MDSNSSSDSENESVVQEEESAGSSSEYEPVVDTTEGNRESSTTSTPRESTSSEDKVNDEKRIESSSLSTFTGDALPYDLNSLTWDRGHRYNKEGMYCYCGQPRTRDSVMMQCLSCRQWYHLECLKQKPKHPPLFGEWSYVFKCAICAGSTEFYEQQPKNWTDIVRVAIYNLTAKERLKGSEQKFFQYKEQICAFIDKYWDNLCVGKVRTKTWENTIGSALSTKSNYFVSGAELKGTPGYWGLRNEEDPSLNKGSGGAKIAVPNKKPPGDKKRKSTKPPGTKTNTPKKQKVSSGTPTTEQKTRKKVVPPPPVVAFMPKVPFHPKTFKYDSICLAKENSAPQVRIQDKFTVTNDKGYRMCRASFGVKEGAWYFEIHISPHSGNTRLGWSTEKGDLQAPVGYDKYSYSYRDKEGTKFHQSRGYPYGVPYGPGDTIGFYINLPPKPKEEKEEKKEEEKKEEEKKEEKKDGKTVEEPKVLPGSKIAFFRNGQAQGVAFQDIFEGCYYPAASLYMGGTVKFNFGPTFKFAPPVECKPICDVVPSVMEEQDPNEHILNPPEPEPVPEPIPEAIPTAEGEVATEGQKPEENQQQTISETSVASTPNPMSEENQIQNENNSNSNPQPSPMEIVAEKEPVVPTELQPQM